MSGAPRDLRQEFAAPFSCPSTFAVADLAPCPWVTLWGLTSVAAMRVRREGPADRETVREIQAAAFSAGEGEPMEVRLLDALRATDSWIPALSWVAEVNGRVVGHCVSTRGHVGDVSCVGLGPIGVVPDAQGKGVGSALINATIGAADALGEPLIALLGEPTYYTRFGFTPATSHGIEPPESAWGDYFQVLRLSAWTDSIRGSFQYAPPFNTVE